MRCLGCMPDAHQVLRRCSLLFNPDGISKVLAHLSISPGKMVDISHPLLLHGAGLVPLLRNILP